MDFKNFSTTKFTYLTRWVGKKNQTITRAFTCALGNFSSKFGESAGIIFHYENVVLMRAKMSVGKWKLRYDGISRLMEGIVYIRCCQVQVGLYLQCFPSQSNTLSVASPRELHRQITLFLCWKKTIALVLSMGEQSAQDIFEQWSIISKHNLWLSPTKQSFRRRRRILSTNVLVRLSIIDHSVRYIPHVYVTRMSFVLLSRWTKQLTTQPYNNEINIEKLCSTFAWLTRDRLQSTYNF